MKIIIEVKTKSTLKDLKKIVDGYKNCEYLGVITDHCIITKLKDKELPIYNLHHVKTTKRNSK